MATPAPSGVRKFREVEFTPTREAWGTYELDDHIELLARTILYKLQRVNTDPSGPAEYAASCQVLLNVNSPPKHRKSPPPGVNPTPAQMEKAEKVEVDFRAVDEPWNEYAFRDPEPSVIKTKLVVTAVSKLEGLVDLFGEPMYQVAHNTVVAPPRPRKVDTGR